MFEQLRSRAVVRGATSFRRYFVVFLGLTLVQMLSGCIFSSERPPDLSLDVPPNYRAGRGQSAPPALDWWRGFRSTELTKLIEEAQTANLDIAAAIGRIMQADAHGQDRRRAAAARGRFRRQRHPLAAARRSEPRRLQGRAQRQLRDRFLGQEPRRLARRPGKRHRPPLHQGSHRHLHDRQRRDRLFPGALGAGPAADRAQQPRRLQPRAHADQAAARKPAPRPSSTSPSRRAWWRPCGR